jgi:hypothetical protein
MMSSRALCLVLVAGCAVATACTDGPAAATTDPTATHTTTSSGCASTLTLSAGQVDAGVTSTSFCVNAGTSAAEYALIPFNDATAASAAFDVTATGTAAAGALPNLLPSSGSSFDILGASVAASSPSFTASHAFEEKLRAQAKAELTPRIPSARAWAHRRASGGAAFDVIPNAVSIGQILRLNANSDSSCTAPAYRGARVVAISNKAIVVADTLNPSGGYSDAEYAAFGAAFDTLIDPLDRQAFGDVSDIDHNGRVVIFFTKTVNDLTPATSASYIGGFFDARDLFPVTSTPDLDGCAGSNVGEMFYVMVPDPSRGGAFSKANVANEVYGTLAHEYQHLINASRRMYVNTAATDFEDTWLDEGLAHEAEELLFYRVSGLAPRQDLDVAAIRRSAAIISAFNNYQSENFGRYEEFLRSPSQYSAYADNDSLATRGASWSFLRYAADHRGASDGDVWYQLVNSSNTGLANLQGVFGADVVTELRNWGTSVLTDDLGGVDPTYQQPSWNFRSMYQTLDGTNVFPIANVSLTPGTHSVNLTRGGTAYLRFTVAAGGSATVQWPNAPSAVQFTLVRTK